MGKIGLRSKCRNEDYVSLLNGLEPRESLNPAGMARPKSTSTTQIPRSHPFTRESFGVSYDGLTRNTHLFTSIHDIHIASR